MPTNKELLEPLRDEFEHLELFDRATLNGLRNRGQMVIQRVFGPDSSYREQLSSIEFRYMGIAVGTLGGGDSPATKRARERAWLSGQKESIALINTMLEDLELGAPEQLQSIEEPTVPMSNRVFVVHGHDNEMKQAVARTVERLGLEVVILHEKPNRSQTIIEKIERYADVGFAVVLLSPDDTGYSNADGPDAAKLRARQNVILELGYFAGKLGRERVMALHRGEIELPSDYDGVLYTPYDGGSGTWRWVNKPSSGALSFLEWHHGDGCKAKTAGEAEKGEQIVSAEENKAMLRRLVDAHNAGNMDVVDELFTPELAEQAKQGVSAYRSAFPDWREDIVDVVAEEDKVVGRFKCSGTHRGEMMGIPPTGRHMEVDEIYFLRVEDGKFVEFWGLEDNLTRMRQLGLLPPRPGALAHILVHYAKKLRSRLRQRR